MPYTPRLWCLRAGEGSPPLPSAVSPIHEKVVRVVRSGADPLLDLPLSRFEADGRPIEARVPWWPETIWFVPGAAEVEALVARGVARGRIWTAAELRQVADLDRLNDADLHSIARVKAMFGCTVVKKGGDESGEARPSRPAWLPFRGDVG